MFCLQYWYMITHFCLQKSKPIPPSWWGWYLILGSWHFLVSLRSSCELCYIIPTHQCINCFSFYALTLFSHSLSRMKAFREDPEVSTCTGGCFRIHRPSRNLIANSQDLQIILRHSLDQFLQKRPKGQFGKSTYHQQIIPFHILSCKF